MRTICNATSVLRHEPYVSMVSRTSDRIAVDGTWAILTHAADGMNGL